VPTIELVLGMPNKGNKGEISVVTKVPSTMSSPHAIESLRGTCRQVHNAQGSGVTPKG
jgi:hypothetical protein